MRFPTMSLTDSTVPSAWLSHAGGTSSNMAGLRSFDSGWDHQQRTSAVGRFELAGDIHPDLAVQGSRAFLRPACTNHHGIGQVPQRDPDVNRSVGREGHVRHQWEPPG